jgi:hypothetical protein
MQAKFSPRLPLQAQTSHTSLTSSTDLSKDTTEVTTPLITPVSEQHQEKVNTSKFRLLGFNIDTNIARLEEGIARESHPEWSANNRASLVTKTVAGIISHKRPDVAHIQECRQFQSAYGEMVDSVTPLIKTFEEHGYGVVVRKYNNAPGDKAFQFITAYDKSKMTVQRSYIKFLTKTPDTPTERPSLEGKSDAEKKEIINRIKDHNFGLEWERGVSIVEFSHVAMSEPIVSINLHFDPSANFRMHATQIIIELTREILTSNPNAKIVMEGDFNTFPDSKGPEQMEILAKACLGDKRLLIEASEILKLPNGEPAYSTFYAFPYDFLSMNKDIKINELIEELAPEFRDRTREAFVGADITNPYYINDFLRKLDSPCRKQMIGKIFDQCKALGGVLDHVFQHGFDGPVKCKLLPSSTYPSDQITSFNNEAEVRKYILDTYDKGPAFASDHQPILVTFKRDLNDKNWLG